MGLFSNKPEITVYDSAGIEYKIPKEKYHYFLWMDKRFNEEKIRGNTRHSKTLKLWDASFYRYDVDIGNWEYDTTN